MEAAYNETALPTTIQGLTIFNNYVVVLVIIFIKDKLVPPVSQGNRDLNMLAILDFIITYSNGKQAISHFLIQTPVCSCHIVTLAVKTSRKTCRRIPPIRNLLTSTCRVRSMFDETYAEFFPRRIQLMSGSVCAGTDLRFWITYRRLQPWQL